MPRNHLPGASTLRNRNRITNKTRLKIFHGNLDADALLIPDEDEEKHRLTNLVAGVDAEDANEHHLQEVLSAAHRTSTGVSRSATKGVSDKQAPTAYIPTPDSTGIVDNYNEFYPSNRWRDPATYVCSSLCVEEALMDGLAGGFTHYMDERDKDWLDKNNEEARGEGTSAQGAISASGTRTSARSAKAKGKEPDISQPVVISEDEFELVIGIFEKVTHEKTEYLHHGLENGMPFPAFADYQDTFLSDLPPAIFATFTVPSWIPKPPQLLRIARTIYPYWKERRLERNGHRIIPTLNGDESDTLNESYICFRRREIKAIRKTRASQVTSSDRLTRLQDELAYPLELAKLILNRDSLKKEAAQQAQGVWERRLAMVDLKRKYPALGDKVDEELLVDKERPVKKAEPAARIPGLRIRTQDSSASTPRQEAFMRPRERINSIREQIESTLARQKDQDHHWEDQIDNVYQPPAVPYASRLFKYIPPSEAPSWPPSSIANRGSPKRPVRSVRLRIGRGGRRFLDRCDFVSRTKYTGDRRSTSPSGDSDAMEVDEDDSVGAEHQQRLEERWKYDRDNIPAFGPQGQEEQDRILVDEYQTKYLRHTMTLLADQDQTSLVPDTTIPVATPDGRQLMVIPFRLGVPPSLHRRDQTGAFRPIYPALAQFLAQPAPPANNTPHSAQLTGLPNGTTAAIQPQLKKMPPPNVVPQMRISSNGGMRPPTVPTINGLQSIVPIAHTSPPQPVPVPQHTPSNGVNGVASRPAIAMPHVDVVKTEVHQPSALVNGSIVIDSVTQSADSNPTAASPTRPKSQAQPVNLAANGFHLPMANYAAAALANTTAYTQLANGQALNLQNLKSAFASLPPGDFASLQLQRMPYMQVLPGAPATNLPLNVNNANLKVAAARQMQQWANSPLQRPTSAGTGIEGVNGLQSSPSANHPVAATGPTTNGSRPAMRIPSNGQMSMSPMPQHSPSPLPHIAQSQSPPRLPVTPTMAMASPSIQQQAVGSSQIGY